MKMGVDAGRLAYLAGRINKIEFAMPAARLKSC